LIETDRLIIRLAEPSDIPEIVRFHRENSAFLQPFSPTFGPELFDEAEWRDQVSIRRTEFERGESFRGFIFPRVSPRHMAGNMNLTQVVRGAFQACSLGYNLAEGEQGRGYMTEAVRATVAFAFRDWRLHRVAAQYMPHNRPSAAVLERCGFTIEGIAPAYLRINGRWEDHVLTAVTNPEWSAS